MNTTGRTNVSVCFYGWKQTSAHKHEMHEQTKNKRMLIPTTTMQYILPHQNRLLIVQIAKYDREATGTSM